MAVTNAVIDISHHQGNPDFAAVKEAGILAVIHKATEGDNFRDPDYPANKENATAAGLMWAAYHFGTNDDPIAQAEYFLAATGTGILMALDLEPNGNYTMSLDAACDFLAHVQQQTGQWPGLYVDQTILNGMTPTQASVFANCWLWFAPPTANPEQPPPTPSPWTYCTLWQWTSEGAVAGIAGPCDRDTFNGDEIQLGKLFGAG